LKPAANLAGAIIYAFALAACGGAASFATPAVHEAALGMPGVSRNLIRNPGFEEGLRDWKQCGTVAVHRSSKHPAGGRYSAFAGTKQPPELDGDAAICQTVTVPARAQLEFYVNQQTNDVLKYAWQTAQLLAPSGSVLKTLYRVAAFSGDWRFEGPYDLRDFAGRQVTLKFDVHGIGNARTYVNQYLDDVWLGSGAGPSPQPSPSPLPIPGRTPIKHIIIVLQENRTFDNLFHGYPGADYAKVGYNHKGNAVQLFELPLMTPWDPSHDYENWVVEYNGGKMNGFDLETLDYGSGAPKDFAYGYARRQDVKTYWDLAREGVLGDATFADHRSQSYAGHLYPIAGASGPIDAADPDWYAADNPEYGSSCAVEGFGEAIDILTGATNKSYRSCFDFETIGDLLTKRGVSWRYYVDSADKEGVVSGYASILHVFNGSQWANVVSPETTILSDVQNGSLPAVSWVIGTYADSDHPGQDVPSSNGPKWVSSVFNAVGKSKYWKDSAIILAYDDWGGWYDHVEPTTFDYFEPGFRIPLVIVSPYSRRGSISHRIHYIGSILHFIEHTYGLRSLGTSDARSDRFADCFDFTQKPLPYIPVKVPGSFESLFDTNLPVYGRHPQDPAQRD
jgi:phospholipase C